eukprot:jgi/Undpi1/13724/HiC_scaffold_9.g03377.m1
MILAERNEATISATRRRVGTPRAHRVVHSLPFNMFLVVTASLLATGAEATGLRCFSCTDCSVGGALSAQKQQCRPEETFCASVFRPQAGRTGSYSSVDRGCASSLNVACTSDGTMPTPPAGTSNHDGQALGSSGSLHCCSTDLCNGSGDARGGSYLPSEERRRNLMEGNPRKGAGASLDLGAGVGGGEEGFWNAAPPASGSGGSRFATVLVIVGTFSHVLWLLGSLLQ